MADSGCYRQKPRLNCDGRPTGRPEHARDTPKWLFRARLAACYCRRMDAIIFVLILLATGLAVLSRKRAWVITGFAVAFIATAYLFSYHATDALKVSL